MVLLPPKLIFDHKNSSRRERLDCRSVKIQPIPPPQKKYHFDLIVVSVVLVLWLSEKQPTSIVCVTCVRHYIVKK